MLFQKRRTIVSWTGTIGSGALLICAANCPIAGAQPAPADRADLSTTATLSLDAVQAIARERNPTFEEFAANLEAARAQVVAALAYPNPEIELSAGMARSRVGPVERRAEFGIGIVQPIELPGKRRTRRDAAEAGLAVVARDEDVFRAQLRAEVAKACDLAVYLRRSLQLAIETAAIADHLQNIVQRRVDAGEAPEIDAIKARIELLKANRKVQSARRSLSAARIALNLLCGNALPAGFVLLDDLPSDHPEMDAESLRSVALKRHPALRRLEALIAQQNAAIRREEKAWQPDLKPGISTGREFDTNGVALTLGFEIPLWSRNRGGIAAAQAELQRLNAERKRVQGELDAGIRSALENDANAREQLGAFSASLREGAAQTLKIETFLYEQGEHDLLQLLDARRTAQETETEYLQALIDAAIARVELEQAMGIGGEKE